LSIGQVFLSEKFNPPENFHNSEFFLTVLEPNVTEIDYEAVMSSKDRLRQVFFKNDEWPNDNMTLEENTKDLIRHELEFKQKKAFAYSVFSRDKENYIGCVYINPTTKRNYDCEVFLWVRDSQIHLDKALFDNTKKWLKDWPVKKIAFPGREISWKEWGCEA